MAEVVVVGAGMGGLGAAIALAAAGREVVVLEAHDRPGGKAGRITLDGVAFDTGPSVLTMVDSIDALFRLAGTTLADEVELLRHDVVFRYHWPDGVALDVHFDPDDTVRSVRRTLGDREGDELAAFLAYAERIWSVAAPAFVFGDAPGFGTVGRMMWELRSAGPAGLTALDPFRSMHRAITRQVRSPHLRDLLLRYATYNGSDPRTAPATLNCIAWVELGLGCWGVRGGLYALVQALVRVAEGLGVTVRTEAPVARVEVSGGAVAGVVLADGERVRADAVVANADVAHLSADLLEGVRHGLRTHERPQSTSGTTLLVRHQPLRGRPRPAPHEVLFPDPYEQEFADLFDAGRAPAQPTVYVCHPDLAHGCATWPDRVGAFLMANEPAVVDPTGSDASLGDRLLRRATEHGMVTDPELLWARTARDLATAYPRTGGGLYGAASNSMFAAFQRPANRVKAVGGLYLASGSAHPGGGVPMCLLSGRAAARALQEDQG